MRQLFCIFLLPGCEIPANVVFVMDESGSVGFNNHLKEKEFIGLVVIITPLMYAALQRYCGITTKRKETSKPCARGWVY